MAAPHIAGLAALMKSANSSLTPAQIESAIKTNARALPGTCTGGCGAGLADATKTVQAVSGSGGSTGGTTFTSTTAVSIPDAGSAVESLDHRQRPHRQRARRPSRSASTSPTPTAVTW